MLRFSTGEKSTCPLEGCSEAERIQMSVVLRCYAMQLQAWRLHERRTALLRPLNAVAAGQLTADESLQIRSAAQTHLHQTFASTSPGSSICAVCERPIRGLSSICLQCGHGGHSVHIRDFFLTSGNWLCPAGCGCCCSKALRPPLS